MADQVNSLGGPVLGAIQAAVAAPVSPRPLPTRVSSSSSGTAGGAAEARTEEKAASQGVDAAARQVADFIQKSPSDLKFMVDKDTGQYYFKIVDPKTHETIRQVPSEEVLAMARRLQQLSDSKGAKGVLVDAEG